MDFQQFKEKYQKKEVREYPNRVTSTPLISVMVQTYQHQEFIKDCLESILKQETEFNFEILLGEDGSTDATRDICIEYAENYPEKIRLFLHHPENKIKVLNILTGNFNALYNFFSARGKFIAFCEGDDFWKDPTKLQKQVDLLRSNSESVLTYHSFIEVNEKGEPLPKEQILQQPRQDITQENLKKLTYHPLLSTACFRNIIQENIPEEMPGVINVDSFLFSLLGTYGEGKFLETISPSIYRRHQNGMWSGKRKEFGLRSKVLFYERLLEFYRRQKDLNTTEHYTSLIKSINRTLFLTYLKGKQPIKAFRLLRVIW